MAGILLLVYKSSRQRVDLVSSNYYEQEIKYDRQIDKEKKAQALNQDVTIDYDKQTRNVTIRYPEMDGIKNITGTVTFYKPDNASLDFNKPVSTDEKNEQRIGTSALADGWWNVKVNWDVNSVSYYTEEKIKVIN
jgi:nitrogen fixation protein FixH